MEKPSPEDLAASNLTASNHSGDSPIEELFRRFQSGQLSALEFGQKVLAVSIPSVEDSESELSAGQSKSPLRARSSAA